MFVHHISYRFENGDIEEFIGSGLTPASAHQNSVYCAKAAAANIRREAFTMARVDSDVKSRTARERSGRNGAIKTRRYLAALL